ncbi:MAG: hypothetical protein CSA39_03110 [Flavobacteriales bacterium]|nr:MAG: hypothetical protein CSA39_03110 [Flavobacteriales bacterium]
MRYRIFTFSCFLALAIQAQVTNSGTPKSWDNARELSVLKPIDLGVVNITVLKKQDKKKRFGKNRPLRIGVAKKVNYNPENAGVWTILPNGDRIWRIGFHSKDAIHLSVNFSKFIIPENASLYLYNDAKTDLLGAYTNLNNSQTGLGTWFVMGDKLWLEYYEPATVKGKGVLEISRVIHGYRLGNAFQKGYNDKAALSINSSGDCNYDVDCDIGNDFLAHKDVLKNAVGYLNMGDGYICTGTLINNTAQDKTPYFITAEHCIEREDDEDPANPSLFNMRFKWISPNPVCAQTTNSTNSTGNFSLNGATVVAKNVGSDALLLKANNNIDPSWDVNFAGWDRSDTNPDYAVSIHHPDGDIMKISRDNDGPVKSSGFTVTGWLIGGVSEGTGKGWEIGVTELGSSGAALFNQNGHIIGQLSGGNAACVGLNDNDDYDLFGRFATAWNGTSSGERLKDWLDPVNSGVTTLNTLSNTLAVDEFINEKNISVFPNPVSTVLEVTSENFLGDLYYLIYNQLGQEMMGKKFLENGKIPVAHLPEGLYFVKIGDDTSGNYMVKKIIIQK